MVKESILLDRHVLLPSAQRQKTGYLCKERKLGWRETAALQRSLRTNTYTEQEWQPVQKPSVRLLQ